MCWEARDALVAPDIGNLLVWVVDILAANIEYRKSLKKKFFGRKHFDFFFTLFAITNDRDCAYKHIIIIHLIWKS